MTTTTFRLEGGTSECVKCGHRSKLAHITDEVVCLKCSGMLDTPLERRTKMQRASNMMLNLRRAFKYLGVAIRMDRMHDWMDSRGPGPAPALEKGDTDIYKAIMFPKKEAEVADEQEDIEVEVDILFKRWINGSLTRVLVDLENMPSGKAAFISGMLVAKMYQSNNEDKVEPFLRLQVEKYY